MTTTPKQWHKAEINRQELLSDVAQYIRRYVACSDDQLTVLALWVLSGYFPQTGVFTSSPYLQYLRYYQISLQLRSNML